jgi:hypothetical protein
MRICTNPMCNRQGRNKTCGWCGAPTKQLTGRLNILAGAVATLLTLAVIMAANFLSFR